MWLKPRRATRPRERASVRNRGWWLVTPPSTAGLISLCDCVLCQGYIIDALLECIPATKQSNPAYRLLFGMQPGAALACPYCGGLIGFNYAGRVICRARLASFSLRPGGIDGEKTCGRRVD
jgi:hypothetical protein